MQCSLAEDFEEAGVGVCPENGGLFIGPWFCGVRRERGQQRFVACKDYPVGGFDRLRFILRTSDNDEIQPEVFGRSAGDALQVKVAVGDMDE